MEIPVARIAPPFKYEYIAAIGRNIIHKKAITPCVIQLVTSSPNPNRNISLIVFSFKRTTSVFYDSIIQTKVDCNVFYPIPSFCEENLII